MQDVAVLVVAKHAIISALVASLVELTGHRPVFPDKDEAPLGLLERIRPRLVLLDCSHEAATQDEVYRAARAAGATVILFSPSRTQAEVEQLAARYGACALAFPVSFPKFSDLVASALASVPREAVAEARAASHSLAAQPRSR